MNAHKQSVINIFTPLPTLQRNILADALNAKNINSNRDAVAAVAVAVAATVAVMSAADYDSSKHK